LIFHDANRLNGVLNIAHRGASSQAPENTFASFDQALETGADGIEFDVQLSKDRVPVIIHDESLDRTTSYWGKVNDFTLADLKKLDAGSWFAPSYQGERIPSLEEIFSRYRNTGLLFNIELKNGTIPYPGLEEAVLHCISKHRLEDRVLISSFNHDSLVVCRRINPDVRTGLLYLEDIHEPWHYARSLECYSVHPFFFYLQSPEILFSFKEHHIPLYPWTVNDPEQMKYLAKAKVEGIITDYPQELRKFLHAK